MENKSARPLICPDCGGEFSATDLLDGDSVVTCLNCGKKYNISEILHKTLDERIEEIKQNAYRDVETERIKSFENVEKEKTQAYREVEEGKRQIERERMQFEITCKEKEESNKYAEVFRKSKFKVVLIIFSVLAALCCAVAFNDGIVAAGVVSIIMLLAFLCAFLMGLHVISSKVRRMYLIPAIIGFILLIPYFALYSSGGLGCGSQTKWDDIILKDYVPKPIMTSAKVMTNSRDGFYIYDIKCSQKEFYDYVENCKDFGYDYEVLDEDDYSFEAYNTDGYKIKLTYIITLSIELSVPMEMNTIEWPKSDIAKLIPQPKSLYGKIYEF